VVNRGIGDNLFDISVLIEAIKENNEDIVNNKDV
jgi:hypothetical protein